MSTSHRNPSTPTEPADTHPRYPERPWIQNGINYGPAILAIRDLAAWAFDVAERSVADWPEGQRRVYTARRFVLARIRGKRARRVPFEDVVFTAGLLARIFDDELRLGMTEAIAILDALHLPTEVVPPPTRPSPPSSAMRAPRSTISPLQPRPTAFVVPEPDGGCDECGDVHPFIEPRLRSAA